MKWWRRERCPARRSPAAGCFRRPNSIIGSPPAFHGRQVRRVLTRHRSSAAATIRSWNGRLRESGSGLATLAVGSEAGFSRFVAGETIAAAIHLHALNDLDADANVAAMKSRSDLQDAVMIAFCRREQGFLVPPGNPLKLGSIEDVAKTRARIAMRPKGAGAQLLLLALLQRAKVSLDQLAAVTPVCPTGPDIAQAIRAGRADTGIATRGVANAAGLDFVPLVWEPFDLVMRQRDYFQPPLQSLFKFLHSEELVARARELGGYDLSGAGTVRFVN